MKTSSLLQVLAAAHLSYMVDGVPEAFSQRGGIMLVGPPENLKTTMAACLGKYNNALVVGDLTVKQLVKIRDQISSHRYQTLVFPAFEKLYKRDQDTASNVEGHIQAMTEEGFSHASFEDHETFVRPAKCLVVGACVEEHYRRHDPKWRRDGFTRRFLWSQFVLDDRDLIRRAVLEWQPLKLSMFDDLPGLPSDRVPFDVSQTERRKIAALVSDQEGKSTPFVLSIKIYAMLKWRYRDKKNPAQEAMNIFEDFAESLSRTTGAALTVD